MIQIKRFIEKVSLMESKHNKDVVIPINEARILRDELASILVDLYNRNNEKKDATEEIKIEISGGKFK
jgi:DNA-binding cell septation regulator SpoVG